MTKQRNIMAQKSIILPWKNYQFGNSPRDVRANTKYDKFDKNDNLMFLFKIMTAQIILLLQA
jgi:hypothetical protein